MSDQDTSNPLAAFNLDIDLTGVETGMPVVEAGHYIVEVDSVEVKDNKAQTGKNLVVICKTCAPTTSVQGRTEGKEEDIKAGYPLRMYLPLQQSDNPDAPDYRKRIAEFQDAVEGTDVKTRNPQFNPFAYKGQRFVMALKVENDPEFGLNNNIKQLSKIPA